MTTPHIKTVYRPDGTMVRTPVGFVGQACHKATQPYEWRQGHGEKVPTAEATAGRQSVTESEQQREKH